MRDRNSSIDFAGTTSSVRLFQSGTVCSAVEAVSVGVCFCTIQREAAAVVSGEPPDDVAGGEVRSTGGLNLPLVQHKSQKGFCWNGWDETFGNFVVLLYVHRDRGAQEDHLDFHTAPEL